MFNQRGEILLQQLARRRKRHPGCWGSSVTACAATGETHGEAIVRRAREELGVHVQSLGLLGKTSMSDEGCRTFISVFSGHRNGSLTVDKRHVSEVGFLPVADVIKVREMESWVLTPTFVQLLDLHLYAIA